MAKGWAAIYACQALQRRPAALRRQRACLRHGHEGRGTAACHPAARRHGLSEPRQPDRLERGRGGCGLRARKPRRPVGGDPQARRRALRAVGMYEYRTYAPQLLSGGQKQRVAIAGVLAMQPQCVVLDEPTAMLDPQGRREVLDTIERLNREKRHSPVILITHHMDEAVHMVRDRSSG